MIWKDIGIIASLIMSAISVFMIFDSRSFVKKYLKPKDENVAVQSCKILGAVVLVICLYFMYVCK